MSENQLVIHTGTAIEDRREIGTESAVDFLCRRSVGQRRSVTSLLTAG